jgi:hypothetical protein
VRDTVDLFEDVVVDIELRVWVGHTRSRNGNGIQRWCLRYGGASNASEAGSSWSPVRNLERLPWRQTPWFIMPGLTYGFNRTFKTKYKSEFCSSL